MKYFVGQITVKKYAYKILKMKFIDEHIIKSSQIE